MSDAPATAKRASGHIPGEPGIWIFILGDMLVFGLFFLTFAVYRAADPGLYAAGHRALDQRCGLINTLLLLTSSWFVAMAVDAARRGARARIVPLIVAGMLCGGGFCLVKALEYHAKIAAGITLMTNDFFMFYFMFTGIHLLHVVIGMVVLLCLLFVARRPVLGAPEIAMIEGGAAFWHLVDLLWIVLFCLFYLIR